MKMEKRFIRKMVVGGLVVLMIGVFTGCSEKTEDNQSLKNETTAVEKKVEVESEGVIKENFDVPVLKNPTILEQSTFNGNNHTLLYRVKEEFDDVLDFYVEAFELDNIMVEDGTAYFEGFAYKDIFVKGLTIEKSDQGVNVYLTYEKSNESAAEATETDSSAFEDYQGQALDEDYPIEIIPIYENAKIMDISMVPNKKSGFVDLMVKKSEIDMAISFYESLLGEATSQNENTTKFKGELQGIKYSILINKSVPGQPEGIIQIVLDESN